MTTNLNTIRRRIETAIRRVDDLRTAEAHALAGRIRECRAIVRRLAPGPVVIEINDTVPRVSPRALYREAVEVNYSNPRRLVREWDVSDVEVCR